MTQVQTCPGSIELAKGAFVQSGRAAWAMTPIFGAIFAGFALLALWQDSLTAGASGSFTAGRAAASLAIMVASSGLTALLAVVVHRYILLREVARFADLPRLVPIILEFAVVTLIFQMIVAAVTLILVPIAMAANSGFVFGVIITAVIVAATYAGLRISLVFPAIAVETPGRSLRAALRDSYGLVLRLFLAVLLSGLAVVVVAACVGAALASVASLAILAGVAFDMAIVATSVAIVSQVYAWRLQQLAESRDAR